MTFKTQLAADMSVVFLNSDEFAEDITYTPDGGAPVAIKAIVTRQGADPGSEDQGRILQNRAEILIANHATAGVTSVKKGADKVQFPPRLGGSDATWVVVDVLGQDPGAWNLLVQR